MMKLLSALMLCYNKTKISTQYSSDNSHQYFDFKNEKTKDFICIGEQSNGFKFLQTKKIFLSKLKRHKEALIYFQQALNLNSQSQLIYFNYGNTLSYLNEYFYFLQELKRYEDAIQLYDKAIQLDPNNDKYYINKGSSLQQYEGMKKYEISSVFKKLFSVMIRLSYYNKGLALFNLNRWEDALICYESALQIDPLKLPAYNNKGNSLFVKRNDKKLIATKSV